MDFEEREQRRRRQLIKVIIAEVGMVLSVIAIVVVATLAAMGFFVTSSGKIEQSGLIQIHSMPTGATVELDGSTIFSRTNLSRSLTAGEHSLKLSRDGYDTWQKTIKMSSVMLMRLYYPRLFLLNRKSELALRLDEELEFYLPSLDRMYILYAASDSATWNLVNVRDDELKTTQLDLSKILPGITDGKFLGEVKDLRWSNNSDKVLAKIAYSGKVEWVLINLRDLKQSLNLSQTFGLEFTQVEMIDDGAAQLFVLENQQLRRINTNDQSISRVLLKDVMTFANNKTNLVYVMQSVANQGSDKEKIIGVYRDGEKGGTVLTKVPDETSVTVALTRLYDEDYLAYAIGNNLSVYYGALPSYREDAQNTDFSSLKILIDKAKLKMAPESFSLSPEGEYIVASREKQFMVVDLETGELIEYDAMTAKLSWLDGAMMMAVDNDSLWAWDFDNTNQRQLVRYLPTDVKDNDDNDVKAETGAVTTAIHTKLAQYPAMIADNDRWLYYLTETNSGLALMRERIRD